MRIIISKKRVPCPPTLIAFLIVMTGCLVGRSNLREKFILGSWFKGYSSSGKGGID